MKKEKDASCEGKKNSTDKSSADNSNEKNKDSLEVAMDALQERMRREALNSPEKGLTTVRPESEGPSKEASKDNEASPNLNEDEDDGICFDDDEDIDENLHQALQGALDDVMNDSEDHKEKEKHDGPNSNISSKSSVKENDKKAS